jgi:tetratricopeptide (TPR) repeat protein
LRAHQEAEKHIQLISFKLRLTGGKVNYAIGWDLYRLRRYDEAIAHYVKAVQFDQTYQEAVYEIGRVYLAQGDQEAARQVTYKLDPYLRDLLLKEMEIVEWGEKGGATSDPNPLVFNMDQEIRPTILYREKAKYTSMAKDHNIQGIVALGLVFGVNGKIRGVRIIRDLPYGLTAQALIAMQKIKFKPAMKAGKPVSVRGMVEFSFNLY